MSRLARLIVGTTLGLMLISTVGIAAASAGANDHVAATKNVAIKDNFFSPSTVQIHKGDRVKWTNQGSRTHTTTSDTGLWNKTLNSGATFTRTFNQLGTFKYHCNIHPSMKGTVKVVA
jgi:plastocyanin